MKPTAARFLGASLVGLGLIAAVIGAFRSTQKQARLSASAVIQIERDESDLPSLGDQMPAGSDMEYILKTETEVVASALILDPVIQSLDLNSIWGKLFNDGQKLKTSESRDILKPSIKTTPVPGESRLIIDVKRSLTEDPVSIANAIAQTYCDYRVERRKKIAETAVANFATPFRQAEEPFLLAKANLEAARDRLPADMRADPPQIAKGETTSALRKAQSIIDQLTVRSLMLSNQIAGLQSSGSSDTNKIDAAKREFERVQEALPEAEAQVNFEARTIDAIRSHWLAKEKFDSAEKSFAPYKKKAAEIKAMNSPDMKPPATVIEHAVKAETVVSRDVSRGLPAAVIAGVLLLVGLPMLLSNRPQLDREP